MVKRYLLIFFLALWPMASGAADALSALQQFNSTVASASGQFSQVRLGTDGKPLDAGQQGSFSFARPGKFKWLVDQPYEQLTLSDGKQLYQYDPDLAQVIVRGVNDSVGASPAAILFGSGDLNEAFQITPQADRDGLNWLRAQPRSADAGFAHVDIGFRDALPMRMMLLDSFGQTTRIELSDIVANPVLSPDEFTFTAPEGVDVVKM